MKIITTTGSRSGDKITTGRSYVDLYDEVVNRRNILVIKNAFPGDLLLQLREAVFTWGLDDTAHSIRYPGKSFHRRDHLDEKSMTRHIFHSFNFDLPDDSLPAELQELLTAVFIPLQQCQENLSFRSLSFPMKDTNGIRLHPQVIQYPKGGGFFDYHIHPFEPQRVGLILNLSRKNTDYHSGGTLFRYQDEVLSIYDEHDLGDIAVFRYDLLHAADTVNPEVTKVDFSENAGRWSAVLPLY